MKSIITALLAAAVLGAPVFTQDASEVARAPQAAQPRTPQPPQPAQPPQAPQAERQPAEERERTLPPPPPPAPPPPSERRPVPTANVKVDVTITDQTGTATPVKKVVTMIVADGRSSSVRSNTNVPLSVGGARELPLNVDATVYITGDRRVLLDLRFNYSSVSFVTPVGTRERPAPTTDAERDMAAPRPAQANITENLTVLLTPGIPTVIARSADAAADRTVTVEVKAEILK